MDRNHDGFPDTQIPAWECLPLAELACIPDKIRDRVRQKWSGWQTLPDYQRELPKVM